MQRIRTHYPVPARHAKKAMSYLIRKFGRVKARTTLAENGATLGFFKYDAVPLREVRATVIKNPSRGKAFLSIEVRK